MKAEVCSARELRALPTALRLRTSSNQGLVTTSRSLTDSFVLSRAAAVLFGTGGSLGHRLDLGQYLLYDMNTRDVPLVPGGFDGIETFSLPIG